MYLYIYSCIFLLIFFKQHAAPLAFFLGGGGGVDRGNSNICSSLLRIRGVVAQLAGRREVGPEGSGQVLDAVVSGVRSQVLHPGEEVGGRQAPVGHAALVPGLC